MLTGFEFDVIGNFGGGNIQNNGIVGLDDWIWVPNGATVVGNQEWNVFSTQLGLLYFAKLVLQKTNEERACFHVCY